MRILRVLGVAALFLLVIPRAEAATDDAVVRSYEATYDVGRNGAARVVETLRVRFPDSRPGITREFDASDPNWTPRDLEVTQDGRPAKITTTRDGNVLRVGVGEGAVRRGVHVYRFSYTYDDVLESANDDPSKAVLHWYAIAPNWGMRMNASRIEVMLPNAADDVTCTSRREQACRVKESASGFTVTTGRLAPRTPVEVRTVFAPRAAAAPSEASTPTATPTPTPTPSAEATPSATPTAEPSSQVAGPGAEVVTPEAEEEGSSISGTAVVTTLVLVLLVAAALVWLMSRRSSSDDDSAETLSFLADDVVDGELMDDDPEAEVDPETEDEESPDAVDAEIVEETADK